MYTPLNRLEQQLNESGIPLARHTMSKLVAEIHRVVFFHDLETYERYPA